MENKKASKKIQVEKQIFYGYNNAPMKWSDIKNLELEDDDVIHSGWVDDEDLYYHGYWHKQITRIVEESDEEFNKRIARNNKSAEEMKQRRYESYLKLKEEFENGK